MAQNYDKYELDNNSGQGFRLALNNILEAAVTQNSGPDSPNTSETSYPYQVWVDTDALPAAAGAVVKIRDAATATSWYSLYKTDANGQPTGAVATGSYSISTNDTAGTGGTTAITVDTSQRVGIGTASPGDYSYSDLVVSGSTGGMSIVTGTSDTGRLVFADGIAGVGAFRGAVEYDHSSDALSFASSGTERVRIDSSGRLLINDTTVGSKGANSPLQVKANTDASAVTVKCRSSNDYAYMSFTDDDASEALSDIFVSRTAASTGSLHFSTNNGGTFASTRMTIDNNGYVYIAQMPVGGTANMHWSSNGGQLFVTSSSERFKHGITAYDKGLTELMQLEPKYFTYNDEPGQKQRAGFIAEDFHALGLTEYVEYWNDEDGNATVPSEIGYSNMVAILVKSIQEQQAMIETLQAKVAALESA